MQSAQCRWKMTYCEERNKQAPHTDISVLMQGHMKNSLFGLYKLPDEDHSVKDATANPFLSSRNLYNRMFQIHRANLTIFLPYIVIVKVI